MFKHKKEQFYFVYSNVTNGPNTPIAMYPEHISREQIFKEWGWYGGYVEIYLGEFDLVGRFPSINFASENFTRITESTCCWTKYDKEETETNADKH